MNRGSGSSLKYIFRAPVVTWMSSHFPSCRFTFSSVAQDKCSKSERHQRANDQRCEKSHVRLKSLTVIDGEAQLLYDGQVSADPVQAVDAQTCSVRQSGDSFNDEHEQPSHCERAATPVWIARG